MTTARELHDKAMDSAFFAMRERTQGNSEEAARLFDQALQAELAAITELENLGQMDELTRSIWHRSAATLALDCRNYRLAEQLASKVLSQDPHPAIAWELRELLEQVYFHWNLDRSGLTLGEDEIQLSLSGPEVGFGVVNHNEIYGRVDNSSKLIYRIVERRTAKPFREGGSPTKDVQSGYQTFVSAPRTGSFAVTLKLGNPTGQLSFPGVLSNPIEIVDEFMDLIEFINRSRVAEIQERIPDPAYLRNFFGLAKKIAPDGQRIRLVNFTVRRGEKERSVEVAKPASEFPPLPIGDRVSNDTESIGLQGTLLYANATQGDSNEIRIVDGDRKTHRVKVPQGMMNDIVRPMWDSLVEIQGVRQGENIILQDIWPVEEDSE